MAAERIKGWLQSAEMANMTAFTQGAGQAAFKELIQTSSSYYPQYAEEIRGIADGAGLPLHSIWALNLISELEALMGVPRKGHCSDMYAVSNGSFCHGHNEDWEGDIKLFVYFVKYRAAQDADFESCAGLVYPGSIVGWAPTWNSHGIY